MQNAKCKMQNAKCKMQNAKCKMQNAKCKMQNAMISKHFGARVVANVNVLGNFD
jgi:hypothetical protein